MTDEEKQEIVQDVINEVVTQSISIDELASATSVSDISSFPAYKTGTTELVTCPVSLLTKLADDAAAIAVTATEAANLATEEAKSATEEATEAAKAAAEASATINEQLKGLTLEPILETEYEEMDAESKVDTTLYLCYEEET